MTPINARNKFYFKRRKLLSNIFLIFILISGYSIYSYYNRLVRVNSFSNADDVFELYRDWSKSSNYYMKYSERMNAENYYLIKKNGEIYFKYKHNYQFDVSYRAFYFYGIEQDSLVLLQKGFGDKYGSIFLKMPINRELITKKNIRIIPILPGILKDGSKLRDDDSTHYLLDDYKKVPVEVINYEDIISDY